MHAFLIFDQQCFQKNMSLNSFPFEANFPFALQPSQQKSPLKIYFNHSHQQT